MRTRRKKRGRPKGKSNKKTDIKPFSCPECNSSFSTKRLLNSHQFEHIVKIQNEAMTCELCGRSFPDRASIVKHMETHSRTPTCFCTLCNETFIEFGDLEKHVGVCRDQRLKEFLRVMAEDFGSSDEEFWCLCDLGSTEKCKGKCNSQHNTPHPDSKLQSGRPSQKHTDLNHTTVDDLKQTKVDDLKQTKAADIKHTKTADLKRTMDPKDTEYVCEQCGAKWHGESSLAEHCKCHFSYLTNETGNALSPESDDDNLAESWRDHFFDTDRSMVYSKTEIAESILDNFLSQQPDGVDTESPKTLFKTFDHWIDISSSSCDVQLQENESKMSEILCKVEEDDDELPDLHQELGDHSVDVNQSLLDLPPDLFDGWDLKFATPLDDLSSREVDEAVLNSIEHFSHEEMVPSSKPILTTSQMESIKKNSSVTLRLLTPPEDSKPIPADEEEEEEQEQHTVSVEFFRCPICNVFFDSHDSFQLHISDHLSKEENKAMAILGGMLDIENQALQCRVCDKTFATRNGLSSHAKVHDEVSKPFKCSWCPKSYWTKLSLDIHCEQHAKGREQCHVCGERFNSRFLLSHVRSHNTSATRTMSAYCEACGTNLPSISDLIQHQFEKHGVCDEDEGTKNTYICFHCKEETTHRSLFIAHMASHTGAYPFECSICDKGFFFQALLKAHTKHFHNLAPKTLVCIECEQEFCTSTPPPGSNLCGNEVTWSFQCGKCGVGFRWEDCYESHRKMHEGGVPLWCEECRKTFTVMKNWTSHQRLHREDNPARCDDCNMLARQRKLSEGKPRNIPSNRGSHLKVAPTIIHLQE